MTMVIDSMTTAICEEHSTQATATVGGDVREDGVMSEKER